jgi:hypothetical protein
MTGLTLEIPIIMIQGSKQVWVKDSGSANSSQVLHFVFAVLVSELALPLKILQWMENISRGILHNPESPTPWWKQ